MVDRGLEARLRNWACGAAAEALIAAGEVRKARRVAHRSGTVTAVYFHNPNRRLFEQSIGWLIDNGYIFISVGDLESILHCGAPAPRGAVWLSFDDGCRDVLQNVLPVIRKHRIPVTLFIPTGIVEGSGILPWLHSPNGRTGRPAVATRDCLSIEELRDLSQLPEVTCGTHTSTHLITPRCTPEQARVEIGEAKLRLESWLGKRVTAFAYPEGRYDGRERALLYEYGYRLAATTDNAMITSATDPYLVPRFSIGDNISFPEAVCCMAGIWYPIAQRVKALVARVRGTGPSDLDDRNRGACVTHAGSRDGARA